MQVSIFEENSVKFIGLVIRYLSSAFQTDTFKSLSCKYFSKTFLSKSEINSFVTGE